MSGAVAASAPLLRVSHVPEGLRAATKRAATIENGAAPKANVDGHKKAQNSQKTLQGLATGLKTKSLFHRVFCAILRHFAAICLSGFISPGTVSDS